MKVLILQKNKEEAQKQMLKVKETWAKKYKVLAYYIEHDELEKVKTQLTGLEANLEVGEYKLCISELDITLFILEHIQDKYKFSLDNIF